MASESDFEHYFNATARLSDEVASLQTALVAATKDAENWRKDVSRWKQNFSEVNAQLTAANARADDLERERAAEGVETARLRFQLQQANARAEAAEATVKRQMVWTTAGLHGKADDDRINADKLVAIDAMVTGLEERAEAAERERDEGDALNHHLIYGDMVRTDTGNYICGLGECAFHAKDLYRGVPGWGLEHIKALRKYEQAEADRDEAVGLLRVLTAQGVNVADFQQAMAGTRAFLARLPSATEGATLTPDLARAPGDDDDGGVRTLREAQAGHLRGNAVGTGAVGQPAGQAQEPSHGEASAPALPRHVDRGDHGAPGQPRGEGQAADG